MSFASDLTKRMRIFNGPVNFDTITTTQLASLLCHQWRRRKVQVLADGVQPDNASVEIDKKWDAISSEATAEKEENEIEVVHRLTKEQKRQIHCICDFVKSICSSLCDDNHELGLRARSLGIQTETDEISLQEITALVLNLRVKIEEKVRENTSWAERRQGSEGGMLFVDEYCMLAIQYGMVCFIHVYARTLMQYTKERT